MAYSSTFRIFVMVLSYSFLECRLVEGFSIIEYLESEFVVYRLRASFNGEFGN
jgi:hypothetical protein